MIPESQESLPASIAHYELGRFAELRGDRDNAVAHYAAIASTQSQHDKAATRALARIELLRDPGRYLRVRADIGPFHSTAQLRPYESVS